jgi:hypothetical protein
MKAFLLLCFFVQEHSSRRAFIYDNKNILTKTIQSIIFVCTNKRGEYYG